MLRTDSLDVDGSTVLCVLQDPNTQRLNQQGALIAQFAVTWKSPLATAGNSSADPILHPRRWLHGYGRRQNGLCDDLAFLEEDARTAGSSHDHVARQGSGDLQIDNILVGAVPDRVGHATQAALGSVHADVLPMLAVAGTKALAVLWPNSLHVHISVVGTLRDNPRIQGLDQERPGVAHPTPGEGSIAAAAPLGLGDCVLLHECLKLRLGLSTRSAAQHHTHIHRLEHVNNDLVLVGAVLDCVVCARNKPTVRGVFHSDV
mmetsp:Transcript_46455/g.64532  ORF Transcript_46455/g.64532 Transcript_46455/m.64532 type:complete len:260 (+) Transcript_46455:297-1076(+)